jgi:hypothetical protein
MSDSLGLKLLREGVITPAELVEAHRLCSAERRRRYEAAPVVGALVAALERFHRAERERCLQTKRTRTVRNRAASHADQTGRLADCAAGRRTDRSLDRIPR